MIVEGKNAVQELLKSGQTVEKIVVQKDDRSPALSRIAGAARENGLKVQYADRALLDKLSPSGRHQGVVAVTTEYRYYPFEAMLDEALSAETPALFVLLDGVEDPHNVGAVLRVADSTAASGVILPKHRSCGVTDTAVRTSAGAAAHVKVAKVTNLNDAVRALKDRGVFVFAADMAGESVYRTDLTGHTAIVIGGENTGVHTLTKKLADGVISLPQLGKVNSLNASVAAGVFLYEAVRQRRC